MNETRLVKVLKYTVVLEPAEDGGYVVSVPSLPGCMSQGETVEEALRMIKDAISGYIFVLKKQGEEIPNEPEETIISKVAVPQPAI